MSCPSSRQGKNATLEAQAEHEATSCKCQYVLPIVDRGKSDGQAETKGSVRIGSYGDILPTMPGLEGPSAPGVTIEVAEGGNIEPIGHLLSFQLSAKQALWPRRH